MLFHCMLQDKLLSKLEENEPELATSQEDEVCEFCHHLPISVKDFNTFILLLINFRNFEIFPKISELWFPVSKLIDFYKL